MISQSKQNASFEIKSAEFPALSLHLKTTDIERLKRQWLDVYGASSSFFSGENIVIVLSDLQGDHAADGLDFQALSEWLRVCHLNPLAVMGGSAEQMQAAEKQGLSLMSDLGRLLEPKKNVHANGRAGPSGAQSGSLMVTQPVRSGQRIYAQDRDLVILSMVNPGAEIIADGHIHVYAPLRGRAIAGARGWQEAQVFSLDMMPELVSVAGVYRTSDEAWPDDVWGKAARIGLSVGPQGEEGLYFSRLGDG